MIVKLAAEPWFLRQRYRSKVRNEVVEPASADLATSMIMLIYRLLS